MTDFLLELRSEEIPARMQAGARGDLERLFRDEMHDAGVTLGDVTVWSTPRRLALIARDLPDATEDFHEEIKGPKVGAPQPAVDGFLRKVGLTKDFLEERNGTYFAVIAHRGRATREVLAEAIPAIVRAFPWPKSMRWGAASLSTESLRWVRPLSGIVAILGEDLVECLVDGVASGYATLGHRFHHPGEITIGGASDYQEKLRACHVIVDHAERQDLIRERATAAAADAGLSLVEDEGLVIENAGLTEWPVPLLGRFDEAFLEVPPEVIQLTARTNQKYFVCHSSPERGGGPAKLVEGQVPQSATPPGSPIPPVPLHRPADGPPPRSGEELANAFVCTANIEASDGGEAIVAGNRKVLAARLSDARFFWEQDRKVPLADQAKKLERITFHEQLGTLAEKAERVAKLTRWLVEEGIVGNPPHDREELADLAEQAARLCKADLVTEMVGEFPELQGLMGGYYARAEGLPDTVADAIGDHYKPVGHGDDVPIAPVTVAVSLADKLDTLTGFFGINERPTGSKDPFALRRAALGIIRLILENNIRVRLPDMLAHALRLHAIFWWSRLVGTARNLDLRLHTALEQFVGQAAPVAVQSDDFQATSLEEVLNDRLGSPEEVAAAASRFAEMKQLEIVPFFGERLIVQQREFGVRHDIINAVIPKASEGDLVRLLARVHALQAFVGTEDGTNLLAGYKRAANILKKEDWHEPKTRIPRTGEEDPLAVVDDPDLAAAVAARLELQKQLSYTPDPAEKALIDALDSAGPRAASAVEAEDFAGAMGALASLRTPIDRFFDEVTVNDQDPDKRASRLTLLARFRGAVHQVADFSRIEG